MEVTKFSYSISPICEIYAQWSTLNGFIKKSLMQKFVKEEDYVKTLKSLLNIVECFMYLLLHVHFLSRIVLQSGNLHMQETEKEKRAIGLMKNKAHVTGRFIHDAFVLFPFFIQFASSVLDSHILLNQDRASFPFYVFKFSPRLNFAYKLKV